MRLTSSLVGSVLTLLLVVLMAACSSQVDSTPPTVAIGAVTGDTVDTNDTINVTVRDAESGIARVAVRLNGRPLANHTVEPQNVSLEPVTITVTIGSEITITPGAEYRLEVVATNGVGRDVTRAVVLTGAGEVPIGPGGEDPNDPDPANPGSGEKPAVTVYWKAPTHGRLLAGTAPLEVLVFVEDEDAVESVLLELFDGSGQDAQYLTRLDGNDTGTYAFVLDTLRFVGGDYLLQATVKSAEGGIGIAVRPVTVAAQLPTVAFNYPTPTPGLRLAGRVGYSLSYSAPRGLAGLELTLIADGAENLIYASSLGEITDEAGVAEGSFFTFDVEAGSYTLVATITDVMGNAGESVMPVEILPPFMLTTPVHGDGITGDLVVITLGVNGILANDIEIISAEVYVNNTPLAFMDQQGATDNFSLIYVWDPSLDSPAHDSTKAGERHLTVLVDFQYLDEAGDPVHASTRFTDAIILDYQP